MGVWSNNESGKYLLMHQKVRQVIRYSLQPKLHHVGRRGKDSHLEGMARDIIQIHEKKRNSEQMKKAIKKERSVFVLQDLCQDGV